MKKATIVFTALLALTSTAFAGGGEQQLLHLSGNAWEDGGFPPSNPGDGFSAVGILNAIENPIVWDTANYSYTWYVRDLVAVGETVFGSTHIADYTGGLFTIYVDLLPSNHNYGINPPNATAPSTFSDGISTYLDGFFTDFTVTFNDATASGSFVGTLNFTGGDVFPLLDDPEGWTFGSNIADVSPEGYDVELNGDVFLTLTVSVEAESWGGIKQLYR